MRSWFGLDVLACLPVTYVEMVANHLRGDDGGGSGSKVKALKILRESNKLLPARRLVLPLHCS